MRAVAVLTLVHAIIIQASLSTRIHDDTPRSRVKRIIGGETVDKGDYPWLVSLQGKIPDKTFLGFALTSKRVYCGASLISPQWLLSAAHCFVNEQLGSKASDPDNWHALLGDVQLSVSTLERIKGAAGRFFDIDDMKNWYMDVDEIIIHPDYDPESMWANDIALLKLEDPVPSGKDTPEIQSIQLPEQGDNNFPQDDAQCIMKGWGCASGGGFVQEQAHEIILPKIPDTACTHIYGINTQNRICAGHNLASKGICSGDSGGPLVCKKDNSWVQVGIASFTSAKRPGDVPGAFTRVSSYVDWISNTID